jgi:hypothetical protein
MASTDITTPIKWRKSSYSGDNGNCVEVALLPNGGYAIRDSKHPSGATLVIDQAAWEIFISRVRS